MNKTGFCHVDNRRKKRYNGRGMTDGGQDTGMEDEQVYERILENLSEGMLLFGKGGVINYANQSAADILRKPKDELIGKKFANVFFHDKENDDFNQAILDAVYDHEKTHINLVRYFNGNSYRQLKMSTSLMKSSDPKEGVIVLIGDLTELAEIKLKHAEQTAALLDSLVRALSTAIEERSRYNANHTKNMVMMAAAFLKYLDATDSPHRFEKEQANAFIMSVWLHDVGKLAVPLSVMDKSDRLGHSLDILKDRLTKMRLLCRISVLEGRLTQQEYETQSEDITKTMEFIDRINRSDFLSEEDFQKVQELSKLTYHDENGEEQPVLTEQEVKMLSIRKGTLTDEERQIMQSHASVTARILEQVAFPDGYRSVPFWAASHHELLNGKGYPAHLTSPQIPFEVRLLTILDIYEALTAKDRPYKKPMPPEKAFMILNDMVKEGSLDGDILSEFQKSMAWQVAE